MMNSEGQHNDFVVSLSGANIDLTIVNIEEMANYCSQRKRLANVVSKKQTYGELDTLNYSLIMNYRHPRPRVVSTKDKPFLHVYSVLSEKYREGLLIAEADTISDSISDNLCRNENWKKNDVDIMICRSFASVTDEELKSATLVRISADPDFDPSVLTRIGEIYGEGVGAIMVAQFFANDNYENVNRYMDEKSEKYSKAGMTEFIDYYELRRQLAYFIYYDVKEKKLVNVERDVILSFVKTLPKHLLPVPEKDIEPFVDMITLPQNGTKGTNA
jgi:hypothetical protein